MKQSKKTDLSLVGNVANNPRYDRAYSAKNGMDAKAIKDGEDNTIYGSTQTARDKIIKRLQEVSGYRRTASGNLVRRDEPSEPQKTEYLRVDKKQFDKDMEFWKRRTRQATGRERLKRKGAVPTKSGKRLFEDFCKEAYKNRTQQTNIDDADLRNIYNAATQLDYDRWLWWIMNEYKGVI